MATVFLLILLTGCAKPTPIERNFSMEDLVIDASVFPEGWEVVSGPRFVEWDHLSSTYGSWYVGYKVETDAPRHTAGLHIYRYHDVSIAQRMYGEFISRQHRGASFPDDTCDGLQANQSQLTCVSYQTHTQVNCNWTGRYDEYIVDYIAWLVPDRMSLSDVQEIICAIDAHVGPYFDPPSDSSINP
jgi:hypothetical protein